MMFGGMEERTFPYREERLAEFGPSRPALGFWHPDPDGDSTKYVVRVGWSDNPPHLTPEMRRRVMKGQPEFLRLAREEGLPVVGSGRVYPLAPEAITVPWRQIPEWYTQWYSLDPGFRRTAALFFARDTDANVIYVRGEYYEGQMPPHAHARALLRRGADWIPGVIDPHGSGTLYDGKRLVDLYCEEGLNVVLGEDYGVAAGIEHCYGLMESNRIKVFAHCENFFGELGLYQYDKTGKPNKRDGYDHLMDCMRIGVASVAIGISKARYVAQRGRTGPAVGMRGPAGHAFRGPMDRLAARGRRAADSIAGF